MTMSLATTETERSSRTLREILPPYAVILYNDEVHSIDFVVEDHRIGRQNLLQRARRALCLSSSFSSS